MKTRLNGHCFRANWGLNWMRIASDVSEIFWLVIVNISHITWGLMWGVSPDFCELFFICLSLNSNTSFFSSNGLFIIHKTIFSEGNNTVATAATSTEEEARERKSRSMRSLAHTQHQQQQQQQELRRSDSKALSPQPSIPYATNSKRRQRHKKDHTKLT